MREDMLSPPDSPFTPEQEARIAAIARQATAFVIDCRGAMAIPRGDEPAPPLPSKSAPHDG